MSRQVSRGSKYHLLCSYLSLSLDLFLGTQDYTPDLISGLKFEMAQVE